MSESFFNKVEGLQACNFMENPTQVSSCEYCKICIKNFFIENLQWLILIIGVREGPKYASSLQAYNTKAGIVSF